MKHIYLISAIILSVSLLSCNHTKDELRNRAMELCKYVPDHELKAESHAYMTDDFYAVLDTMFNYLPDFEELDHEWLYYFVTSNGGNIADYEVQEVEQIDATHAVATLLVRQKWEDGSFDETTDIEQHRLYMEKEDGRWLMSDFDEHKADCIRHINISRRDMAQRDAICTYLVTEIGKDYLQGEICVPTVIVVATDDNRVYCDCFIDWYKLSNDTLKSVSGGNHSGCIILSQEDEVFQVSNFEQTLDGAGFLPSSKRIFGKHYDIYQNIHSNPDVRESCRRLQLSYFVSTHNIHAHYYQDYGWPAKKID